MAAFIGFIVGENGIHFPWTTTLSGTSYADIAAVGGAPAQWDALPTAAKLQIFGLIAALELWGETTFDEPHYMKGGKPGYYPSFGPFREYFRHPPFDLFDPFGFSKSRSEEAKAKSLLAEINNGRLVRRLPRTLCSLLSALQPLKYLLRRFRRCSASWVSYPRLQSRAPCLCLPVRSSTTMAR